MSVRTHHAQVEELARLEYTLNYLEENFAEMLERKNYVDQEVSGAKKRYFDGDAYNQLLVNSVLQSSLTLRLRNIEAARSKPYFARIDFQEDEKDQPEALYLGKLSLARVEDQKLLIVDWRAPIANLYYEGQLGAASYICPAGEIAGKLSLKRQISVEKAKLQGIFDIDLTTTDQFLQASLGANADNRLKEIVSTIQTEQNKVIRSEMKMPLIVQGVAGSGKTTIALHRIAWLIYNYEKSFVPENFMIVAPNRLFLNYISEILPDLGVERVKQATFEDFAKEAIVEKYKLGDPGAKLVKFANSSNSFEERRENKLIQAVLRFKSSLTFKEILDHYLAEKERNFLPAKDFKFENWIVYTKEQIDEFFFNDYRTWPLYQRIEQIKKHFIKRLQEQKAEIVIRLQKTCFGQIDRIKLQVSDLEERQRLVNEALERKAARLEEIERFALIGVGEYLAEIRAGGALEYYRWFLEEAEGFRSLVGEQLEADAKEWLVEETLNNLNQGYLEIEDLAPVLYLRHRLYGLSKKVKVRHIVIDEAQDFNAFQFLALKQLVPGSSFTILGDLAQGIHVERGTDNWQEIGRTVFEGNYHLLILEQSYRTTIEIMEVANQVLEKLGNPNLVKAKPVVRHGTKVEILKLDNLKLIAQAITTDLAWMTKNGWHSIAIIGKTLQDCQELQRLLPKECTFLNGKEKEYHAGIVILPSYLAKGLEFDAVIIADASCEKYRPAELETKLLYVALTRALHQVKIFYLGELTPLLADLKI